MSEAETMQEGSNLEPPIGGGGSFWARQYGPNVTREQILFDIVGGVFLPLACLWFDPVVFQSGQLGPPMLAKVKIAAYSFVAIQILTLLVWLSAGRYFGRFAGLPAGMLLAGGIGATLLGITLFPLSVIGLLAIIGLLGFSPFLVAWVFLRNWLRARRVANRSVESGAYFSAWIGAIAVVIAPLLSQTVVVRKTSQLLNVAIDGDKPTSQQALERLSKWRLVVQPLTDMDRLVTEFGRERNQTRRERIAIAYEAIANDNIENRLAAMND